MDLLELDPRGQRPLDPAGVEVRDRGDARAVQHLDAGAHGVRVRRVAVVVDVDDAVRGAIKGAFTVLSRGRPDRDGEDKAAEDGNSAHAAHFPALAKSGTSRSTFP